MCTTWGVFKKEYYLLHVWRRKVNFPALKQAVIDLKSRFKPHRILIEDKASGTQLIQELKNSGIGVTPYTLPSGLEKVMRLDAQTTFFESGMVILPKEAPWLDDYVEEITGFPGTTYADQVDLTTQFLDHMRNRGGGFHISDEVLRRASIPDPRYSWEELESSHPPYYTPGFNMFGV